MQSLRLDSEFFERISDGRKTTTIRGGDRRYPAGTLLTFLEGPPGWRSITVRITESRLTTTAELTPEDARRDGFATREVLVSTLTRFYQELALDTQLTVIAFTYVRPDGFIRATYGDIARENFESARREMERDVGWASWTDSLTASFAAAGTTREAIDALVGVHVVESDRERGTVVLEIPSHNIDWHYNGVPALLSLVAGDVLASSGVGGSARLLQVTLPDGVRGQFLGPRLGIDGVRRLCSVRDRPIVAFSVKPRLGLSPAQYANVALEAALGGVDVVEDDERLSNQDHSPLMARATAVMQGFRRAGVPAVYSANITGRCDRMIATLEELVSIGVKMVKIDVLPTGFSALQAVSEWIHERQADVAITVYPAMSRLFERAVPRSFVLDLCRLCGAEIVYAGVPPLPGPGRTQETVAFTDAAEIHRLLKRSARWQLSVLPTITTNITPMNIRAYAQLVGNNVGMFVGAGIAAYSGTLREGAAVLMKALQSNHDNSNVFTDDELANCATAGFGNFAKYSDVSREVRDTFNSVRTM